MRKLLYSLLFVVIIGLSFKSRPVFGYRPSASTMRRKYRDPISLIEEDYQKNKIDYETSLIYKAEALFDYDKLPERYKGKGIIKCGTRVVFEIEHNWKNLSAKTRKILETYFIPIGDTTAMIKHPPLDKKYTTEHFTLYYTFLGENAVPQGDNDNDSVPDYVEDFGDILEHCWEVEIGEMGYREIPSEYVPISCYIYDLGDYGMTEFSDSSLSMHFDNDYIGFEYPVEVSKKVTSAHEFFHCIQLTGYDLYEDEWWEEATAVWMEDEVYDELNAYVEYLDAEQSIFKRPDLPLDAIGDDHEYSAVVFPKFLSEHYGVDIIKSIWRRCGEVDGPNSLESIESEVGGESRFEETFKNFTCANYIRTGPDGYEEGLAYPNVHIEMMYNVYETSNNQHYVSRPPTEVGGEVPWEEGTFPNSTKPIALPHLASHYIRFMKPIEVDTTTYMYINFEAGGRGDTFALMGIKVLNNKNMKKFEIPLNGENRVHDYELKIGGNSPTDVSEIIFIPQNLKKIGSNVPYKYSISVVPVFQASYSPNPDNGTTYRVKNLDRKNVYHAGDKVRLEVDMSDRVHIGSNYTLLADFSNVDYMFDPSNVKIAPVDDNRHIYRIEYRLSNKLNDTGEEEPVILKVRDLTNSATHKANEVIFKMRVERPPKVKNTHPSKGESEVPVDLDAITIEFSKAMDTSFTNNAISISPTVSFTPSWSSDLKTVNLELEDKYKIFSFKPLYHFIIKT